LRLDNYARFQIEHWRHAAVGFAFIKDRDLSRDKVLVFKSRELTCAISIESLVEIMRPLPIKLIPDVPSIILGVSIIRGMPTPVVDLGAVLSSGDGEIRRFISVRVRDRQVALAVDHVVGIRRIESSRFTGLPPLLKDAAERHISTIGMLDSDLLIVLQTCFLVPDDVWRSMENIDKLS
jgi:purine-binding chemotaxis protein CheW